MASHVGDSSHGSLLEALAAASALAPREQLSEKAYLSRLRATAPPAPVGDDGGGDATVDPTQEVPPAGGHSRFREPPATHAMLAAAVVAAGGCGECARAARARAAARAQVVALTRSLDAAEADADALRAEVAALTARLATFETAGVVRDGGVRDGGGATARGKSVSDTARGKGDGLGINSGAERDQSRALSAWCGIAAEGGGLPPARAEAEARPHGSANVVAVAGVRERTRGHGSGRGSGVLALTGGADGRVVLTRLPAVEFTAVEGRGGGGGETGEAARVDIGMPRSQVPLAEGVVLAAAQLPAPVLALALRPSMPRISDTRLPSHDGDARGVVAATCMDGSVHLLAWLAGSGGGAGDASSALGGGSGPTVVPLRTHLARHSKHATRAAWSIDGALLVTGAADGSLFLYSVEGDIANGGGIDVSSSGDFGGTSALRVTRLQGLRADAGAVDALAWCREAVCVPVRVRGSAAGVPGRVDVEVPIDIDTLAFAVRGSAVLYFFRVFSTRNSYVCNFFGVGSDEASADVATSLRHGPATALHDCDGRVGVSAARAAVAAAAQVSAAAADGEHVALLSRVIATGDGPSVNLATTSDTVVQSLVLHRVPLSEDGPCVDVGWPALAARGVEYALAMGAGESSVPPATDARGVPTLPLPRRGLEVGSVEAPSDDDLRDVSVGKPGGGERPRADTRGVEGGAAAGVTAAPASASALAAARAAACEPLRVGFNVIDLAAAGDARRGCSRAFRGRSRPLLAAAADTGVVTVSPFGSSIVARHLAGHGAPGPSDAPTRLAWVHAAHAEIVEVAHLNTGVDDVDGDDVARDAEGAYEDGSTPSFLAVTTAGGGAVLLYDVAAGRPVGADSLTGGARVGVAGTRGAHGALVRALAALPGGGLLTVGYDKRVVRWEANE